MTRPSLAPKRGLPNPPGLVVLVCCVPPAVRAVGQLRQLICRCPHVQPCNTVANVHFLLPSIHTLFGRRVTDLRQLVAEDSATT